MASHSPAVLDVTCFNSDGSIATMCGNALRCSAWAAHRDHGFLQMSLHTAGVEHESVVSDDSVWVTAENGAVHPRRLQAVINGRPIWCRVPGTAPCAHGKPMGHRRCAEAAA
ncbi:hypothetical protein [Streptomyces hyaluromycini]|uniref:hypothetical protein n=1 Tax=Streptomyces hyaluromycini TaxID=1377993 RepID=UPI001FE6FE44